MVVSLHRFERTTALRLFGLVAVLAIIYASSFSVDVTEYGVVTRFGNIIRVLEKPGLRIKFPIDRVVRVDKRLLHFKPPRAEYLTKDKKNLVVYGLTTWRITDPRLFLKTVLNRAQAEVRLSDVTLSEIGSVLGKYAFSSLISPNDEDHLFQPMMAEVRERVNRVSRPSYGIEVIDVRVRRLSLPDQNKRNVFQRMQAERGKIAMQYRSEGERESKKIIAAAEREKTRVLAEAYQRAERIKGEGDADAMRIYANSFSADPQFYKFRRTLKAYEKILNDNTTIFLSSDAEIFQMLQIDGSGAVRE